MTAAPSIPDDLPAIPLLLVLPAVFLALLVFALVVVAPMLNLAQKRRRLLQLDQYRMSQVQSRLAEVKLPGGPITRGALTVTENLMQSGGLEDRFAQQVDRAGITLRPHEWVLVRVATAVGITALLMLIFGWIALPFGLLFGWFATAAYHRRRARLKAERFATQLPESLGVAIGALRSGFSLPQALEAMVREADDPIAGEFARALTETRLGMSLEDALDRLAARVQNQDLSWAVMATRVQREVGGNLAEVLTSTVGTIRAREQLRGHVRSLSAEGRMSAWILLALPIGAGLLMFLVRRDYVSILFTDPRGKLMLLVGATLICVGAFWLSRLVRVDV